MPDFTKAIPVVPSTTLNIPEPGSVYKGESTTNGTTVTVSGGLLASNVRAGDSIQCSQTGSIIPEEIHQIISVDSDTELTLATGVGTAPYDFKVYRGNGGTSRVGNNGYSLIVQLSPGDMIKVIPVGQTEEVEITDEGSNANIVDVLSQIKVQRVTESDAGTIIALDTD